ncbi:RNA 2',3'-cyclic phosphodiesterase [Lichenicoccus sp.]|uniref:RNA 2',3'-cyclic phosphodiesterase n=1 Tax=Lichenicoccus sp. TaxID=2781899 RepID=UPI003D0B7956
MRLFVALDLPDALRERLTALAGSLAGARWIPPANLHLTLRFIGEADRVVAEEIDHALAALRGRRFALALSGTGMFGRSGKVVSLWAGVERSEPLERLQAKIETALARIGLPPERRRFQPHVSLARVDAAAEPAVARWIQAHNLLRSESVAITHFTLFSSLLGREQAVYHPEVDYELG